MEKKYLTEKWLANELTNEEREAFEALEDNTLIKRIVENAPAFSASHFSSPQDYDALKARLNIEKKSKKHINWFKPLLKIAGVLVLGVSIYFFFFFNHLTTVNTLAGERKTVQLPDFSEVVLNAVSEISFNEKTWDDNREVSLDGEAFFKVAKGSTFDVLTSTGKVTVVGTHFNVKNRLNFFEVSCFEGKVIVACNNEIKTLLPNDTYRILNGVVLFESNLKITEPHWIDNISYFEKVTLQQVINELEIQYKVVVLANNVDKNLIFTGGFTHNNLKDALESIVLPLNLKYVMETPAKISLSNSD
jgi:transmembrane sensor